MKKLFAVLFSLAAMNFGVFAQNFSFDDVCKKLSENPNMTGDFSQEKLLKNANRPMKSTGTFIISPDGIMWQTKKPFPSNMIVTKSFIKQINSKGVATITDVSKDAIFSNVSLMITSIFNGNSQEIYKSFNVDFSQSASSWKAVLTPKNEQISTVLTSLEISGVLSKNAEIQKMIMTESSSSKTTYNLLNVKFPQELSQNEKNLFIEK